LPTPLSHALVGLGAGCAVTGRKMPLRFWVLSAVCPILPDLDGIGFHLGIPYGHFFGHRGFLHSLFFALLLSLCAVCVFFRKEGMFSKRWWWLLTYFFFITATHGILDAFTNGGLGIALLSPFTNTRYFFPWTPIEVAPLSVRTFISAWGLRVLVSELLWIWLPLLAVVLISKVLRKRYQKES